MPGDRRVHPLTKNRSGRLAAAAALAVGLVLAVASPASAHAQLDSSEPSPGEVLEVAPTQVVLRFDEAVEIDFGSIHVIDVAGDRVDKGGTNHPGGAGALVAVPLPAHLRTGTYVVAWRVVSDDSHPVHGAFVFSVGSTRGVAKANVIAGALAQTGGASAAGVLAGVLRLLLFGSLLVLVGDRVATRWIWPELAGRAAARRAAWAAWTVALLTSVVAVAVQGVYAAGLPLSQLFSPSLFDEVAHTRFGEVALLRVAVLLVAVPLLRRPVRAAGAVGAGRARVWSSAEAVVGVALLLTPGLAGHAATGTAPALGLPLDVVHLAAASVWLGGLLLLGITAGGWAGDPDRDRAEALVDRAHRFWPWALGAVSVVVLSGVVQSIRQVGSVYALFHTTYGRTLLVKSAVVVVMVALGTTGAVLSRRAATAARCGVVASQPVPILERLRTGLRRSVSGELVAALGVLVITALLVDDAPARQAAAAPVAASFDFLGVQVNVLVQPARVGGGNEVHVYVLGPLGQPQAVAELEASLSLAGAGVRAMAVPLVVAGPGHYRANDVAFPRAGPWRLELTVRTASGGEQRVVATVPVH